MQPQESLSNDERIPELTTEVMPKFDASAPYNGMYKSKAEAEMWRNIFRATGTEVMPTEVGANPEIIDIEAREVIIDPESNDETEDIAELIANNEEITVGTEKLTLTPKLKSVAEGVLSSLDMLLGSEPELPEEIDWRHFIMAEPHYDESYDYRLLHQLLNAQYKRKRAELGAGKLLENMRTGWSTEETPPPPEQPPDVPQLEYEGVAEENQPGQKQITQQ